MKIKKINVSKDGQVFQTSSVVNRGGGSTNYASGSTVTNIDLTPYAKKEEVLWEKGAVDNSVVQKKHGLEVMNPYETSVGLYNVAESGKTAFTVGIGTDDENRKNAFTVYQDGSISADTANFKDTKTTNLSATTAVMNDATIKNAKTTNLSATTANLSAVTSQTITNNGKITTNQFKTNTLEAVSGYIQTLLSESITTENLEVTKAAHFFSLVIDEVKAVGGRLILTPASCEIHHVETVSGGYKCYFRAKDGDKQIHQEFEANDQVICQTFNAAVGTSYNVSNTYYWRLCTSVSSTPSEVNGVQYHWIVLSDTDKDKYSNSTPRQGDKLVQLGNRKSTDRQAAIILSAYNDSYLDPEIKAPSLVQYNGINSYELKSHRLNVISKGLNQLRGAHLNDDGKNIDSKIDDLSTTVTNKVSELTQTIDGIGTRVTNTETSIKTISTDVNTVSSATKDNKDAIAETNKTLTGLTQTVKDNYSSLDQKADEISATVSANTSSITSVSDSLGELKKTVDSNTTSISTIDQKADNINATVKKNTSSITTVSDSLSKLKETVDSNTESISSVDQKADDIKSTVEKNTSSITSVSDSLGELKKSVTTNTKNISSVDQKADSISATVSSQTKTIDNIDGRVTTNTEDISKIKQTASSLTSTVESIQNDYASKSELEQTASSITASVNDTFIKIGDTNITLGGDTTIEGNLTLTKSNQGFTLIGDGGTTDIMAKSIGTYSDFKKKSTKTLSWINNVNINGAAAYGSSYYDFTGGTSKNFGNVKVGDVVIIRMSQLSLMTTNEWNASSLSYNNSRYLGGTYQLAIWNGSQTRVASYANIKQTDTFTYTSTFNGELYLRIEAMGNAPTSYWDGIHHYVKPTPNARFSFSLEVDLPTSAYMLIGYDGWAVNFGSNKTVYCGNEGFIASYGEKSIKISSDGIIINPVRKVKVLSGGTPTTWYTVPNDGSVDTVICKGNRCGVKLPASPYEGMFVRIYDKSDYGFLDTNGKYYIKDEEYNTNGNKYSGEQFEFDGHRNRGFLFADGKWWEEKYFS